MALHRVGTRLLGDDFAVNRLEVWRNSVSKPEEWWVREHRVKSRAMEGNSLCRAAGFLSWSEEVSPLAWSSLCGQDSLWHGACAQNAMATPPLPLPLLSWVTH